MGFSIGGVAAPLPVRIYGNTGVGTSIAIDTGGLAATDVIYISFTASIDAGGADLSVTVNDGGAHTLTHAIGAGSFKVQGIAFFKNGAQSFMDNVNAGTINTAADAITMTSITTVTVAVTAGVIYGVNVTVLTTP